MERRVGARDSGSVGSPPQPVEVAPAVRPLVAPLAPVVVNAPPTVHVGAAYIRNMDADSLFCFSPDSWIRRTKFEIVDHPHAEKALLVAIVLSLLMMALNTPVVENLPGVATATLAVEIVLQVFFTVEAMLKIVALGFALHLHAYMRSWWNVADFVIVLLGFLAFVLSGALRPARLFRLMRVLRALAKIDLLGSVMRALFNSAGKLRDVLVLMVLVLTAMSVIDDG